MSVPRHSTSEADHGGLRVTSRQALPRSRSPSLMPAVCRYWQNAAVSAHQRRSDRDPVSAGEELLSRPIRFQRSSLRCRPRRFAAASARTMTGVRQRRAMGNDRDDRPGAGMTRDVMTRDARMPWVKFWPRTGRATSRCRRARSARAGCSQGGPELRPRHSSDVLASKTGCRSSGLTVVATRGASRTSAAMTMRHSGTSPGTAIPDTATSERSVMCPLRSARTIAGRVRATGPAGRSSQA